MKRTPSPNAVRWTAVALASLGLLAIFLGWNGAAGAEAAVDLRAQFPYLISGGLFGLALVGAGLTLVVVLESRRDSQALLRQLETLTAAVERLAEQRAVEELAGGNGHGHDRLGHTPPPPAPTVPVPFEAGR